jgi:hypothetical protein
MKQPEDIKTLDMTEMHESNEMFQAFVGKTVARVDYVDDYDEVVRDIRHKRGPVPYSGRHVWDAHKRFGYAMERALTPPTDQPTTKENQA